MINKQRWCVGFQSFCAKVWWTNCASLLLWTIWAQMSHHIIQNRGRYLLRQALVRLQQGMNFGGFAQLLAMYPAVSKLNESQKGKTDEHLRIRHDRGADGVKALRPITFSMDHFSCECSAYLLIKWSSFSGTFTLSKQEGGEKNESNAEFKSRHSSMNIIQVKLCPGQGLLRFYKSETTARSLIPPECLEWTGSMSLTCWCRQAEDWSCPLRPLTTVSPSWPRSWTPCSLEAERQPRHSDTAERA